MSRKFKEDKSGWAVPQLHVFSGDYCPFKPPRDGSHIRGPDVLVLLARTPPGRDGRHVMRPLAPAGQSLLLGPARRFRHLVVVDVAPMLVPPEGAPSDGQQHDPADALRKEDETREPAKGFGKSLLRLVQRLGLEDVTLAAEGELCPVLLKILENAGGPALSADVWLIRPVLSARFVNNVLAPMGNGRGARGGRRSRVHAVFDDEASRDRRLGMIRHAYPEGEARVLSDGPPVGAAGVLMRVFGDASADGGEPGEYDPDSCDEMGRTLFLSEVKVEMDRHSKQYERTSEDVTDALLRVEEVAAENSEALPSDIDWTKCETQVGALVLRGNRCLLARSLKGRWKGMRIPSVVAAEGESDHDAAARAVVEHTGVDPGEVRELPLLSTVNVYGPNGREIILRLVPVYAVSPPPDGPLENQDMEDDETSYDWYTLANAERRLDERSVAGLRSISLSLVEAANVGLLPNRWGGVFGQELSVSMGVPGADDEDARPLQRRLAVDAEEWTPTRQGDVLQDVRSAAASIAARLSSRGGGSPLPVTLLSGFLGSGKTTLLRHILSNYEGLRVAILVNDMGEVNIDAALVGRDSVTVTQREEHLVEMSNGCICCTLREDLLVEVAKIAQDGKYDYLLIESTGVSEPMPVAETFTFEDSTGLRLGDIATIDTLVTVVDASRFLKELDSIESLRERDWHADPEDKRTISHLLCDQVEFANVVVLNKCDLVADKDRALVGRLIRHMNPTAKLVESTHGAVPLEAVLGTGLFSMAEAEGHPGWLEEARIGEHTPETVEYGISSFTYRARKPFMPHKFNEAVEAMLAGDAPFDRQGGGTVLRAKGFVWLANWPGLQGDFSLAGNHFSLMPGQPWWAEIDKTDWPKGLKEAMGPLWIEPHGDRQQEIVVIGTDLDREVITSVLDGCLLRDEDMKLEQEGWFQLCNDAEYDPFFEDWYNAVEENMNGGLSHDHDHGHQH